MFWTIWNLYLYFDIFLLYHILILMLNYFKILHYFVCLLFSFPLVYYYVLFNDWILRSPLRQFFINDWSPSYLLRFVLIPYSPLWYSPLWCSRFYFYHAFYDFYFFLGVLAVLCTIISTKTSTTLISHYIFLLFNNN